MQQEKHPLKGDRIMTHMTETMDKYCIKLTDWQKVQVIDLLRGMARLIYKEEYEEYKARLGIEKDPPMIGFHMYFKGTGKTLILCTVAFLLMVCVKDIKICFFGMRYWDTAFLSREVFSYIERYRRDKKDITLDKADQCRISVSSYDDKRNDIYFLSINQEITRGIDANVFLFDDTFWGRDASLNTLDVLFTNIIPLMTAHDVYVLYLYSFMYVPAQSRFEELFKEGVESGMVMKIHHDAPPTSSTEEE